MIGYIKYIDEFRSVGRFRFLGGDPTKKERVVGFRLFLPHLNISTEVIYYPTHRKKVNTLRCLFLNRTTFQAEPIIKMNLIPSGKQNLNWTKIKDILKKSDFSGTSWLYLQEIVKIPEDQIILYEI